MNSSDTEAPFLYLNLSKTNGIVSSKIYYKWDGFYFEIVNLPFLDGAVPRSLPMVYMFLSLLVLQMCVLMLMTSSTGTIIFYKLLKQGFRYHKIRKVCSKFYNRHSMLIVKYNIRLKNLLQQGISEPIVMVI